MDSPDILTEDGERALAEGRLADATRLLAAGERLWPNARLYARLAEAHARSRRWPEAAEYAAAAIGLGDGAAPVRRWLGEALLGLGDADGAEAWLREALVREPGNTAATELLARATARPPIAAIQRQRLRERIEAAAPSLARDERPLEDVARDWGCLLRESVEAGAGRDELALSLDLLGLLAHGPEDCAAPLLASVVFPEIARSARAAETVGGWLAGAARASLERAAHRGGAP